MSKAELILSDIIYSGVVDYDTAISLTYYERLMVRRELKKRGYQCTQRA